MATVTKPKPWNRTETQRRIRHPLQSLSGMIRRHVILEGTALAILFLAIVFWGGLLLDFGLFWLFGLDWIKSLDRTYSADTAFFIRAFLLGVVVVGLVALVAFTVLRRLFTEFSDSSLALVLERRFPKQLGDRLITAVELADPKLADEYGYSQEMVDHTIRSAAERVDSVPVGEVFNRRRLVWQWTLAILCTIGVYLLVFGGFAAYLSANEQPPAQFFSDFNRASSIWTKRNGMLMQRVYWPTSSYVEFVRFTVSYTKDDGTDVMKVARDEKRPDLELRAFQWVVYDDEAPDSVRPLRFYDLKDWVDEGELNIPLDAKWGGWIMDIDDLDPTVPDNVIPDAWKQKQPAWKIRQDLKDPTIVSPLKKADSLDKVEKWLDWRSWTVDRLIAQIEEPAIRQKMRKENEAAYKKLEALLLRGGTLEQLSENSASNWNIRKLRLPAQVYVSYVGDQTRSNRSPRRETGNRYYASLADLKESVSLTVYAEDYYTIPKRIELVPPPRLSKLMLDVEEPAYKYFRLNGPQDKLRGVKFQTKKNMSLTGPISQYEVLAGTNVKILATAERELQKGIVVAAPAKRKVKDAFVPKVGVNAAKDNKSFWIELPDIQKNMEFEFRFTDTDNVKGKRHIILRVVNDQPPEETAKFQLAVHLRTASASVEEGSTKGINGFLITPRALVPFQGMMKDDIGLAGMTWVYDYEEVPFSLFRPQADETKDPEQVLKDKATAIRRIKLLAPGFASMPLYPPYVATPLQFSMISGTYIQKDIEVALKEKNKRELVSGSKEMVKFQDRLKKLEEMGGILPGTFVEMDNNNKLVGTPPKQILDKKYAVEDEDGFDVEAFLPALRPKMTEDLQKHYRLRIWMEATDNNIETGPGVTKSKEPVTFLIISANELRALILMQEEKIREKLAEVRDKLDKDGDLTLADQIEKLKNNPKQDLTLVRLRVEEVSKTIDKSSKVINKALVDYQRIYDELNYNRMEASFSQRVQTKIVWPLMDLTNTKSGEIVLSQESVNKTYAELDIDDDEYKPSKDTNLPPDIRDKHIKNLESSRKQLQEYVAKLDSVLEAIGGELDKKKVIAFIQAIAEDQERQTRALEKHYKKVLEDLEKLLQ